MTHLVPRVAVLGPVTVAAADGRPVDLPGATTRALLASLARKTGSSLSIAALADDIWGEDQPHNPRGALQTLVSRLRAAAGAELIRSDSTGYALVADTDLADVQRLESAASVLADGDPARLALLDDALLLWRGEVGSDLANAPVAQQLAAEADALRDRLDAARSRLLIALGRPEDAARELAARASAHPYDEGVHVELMTALAESGRVTEAIAVYAALKERLRDDLGVSPGDGASALHTRLLRGEASPSHAPVRIGLRAAPNALIGRDADLDRIAALIARSRLVTILGPGGLGKTRLAQAVAAASDSPVVAVVPLASIRADDDLAPAIGAALGISEANTGGRLADARSLPDLRTRTIALLSERPTLLVLDNCEQIVDAVAAWTTEMLGSVPALRILTTSRTPISTAAEAVYPLAPLGSDGLGDTGPAVRLFLERAHAVRPGAVLSPDVVARLCERLDGLPLAIELAAARVRTMTAEQIEARLENRFALLRSADRSAPERHRTLEAVIEWSWDLLDADSRRALAHLSLLPAGFSASTAAAVLGADDVDDLIDRLVAQSLLVVTDGENAPGIRFRMLETVREFGLARLAADSEESAAWDAVLGWGRTYARMPGAGLFGALSPLQPEVLREIHAENDNLVAALRHALDVHRTADAVLVFAALTQSWIVRGAFTELLGFAPTVLDALDDLAEDAVPADTLATVLLPCALMALVGDDPRGLRAFTRIRKLRRSAADMSPAWAALTALAETAARPERMEAVLADQRNSADASVRLVGEFITSQLAENQGEAVTAGVSAQRAWELSERGGQRWLAALAASSAAQIASQSNRPAEALMWLERARRGFEAFGASEEMRQQEWTRGVSLLALGRLDDAERLFEGLTHTTELSQEGLEFASIGWFGIAEIDRARGDRDAAAAHYALSLQSFRSQDQRASPWFLMAMASLVSAAAIDDLFPAADIESWARRLRGRMLALHRMRPEPADRPVLGSVLAGWSSWALTVPALSDRGLDALALAEVLGARQDLPSLRLDALGARAAELRGADALMGARARASALPSHERVPVAFAVLAARAD